MTYSVHVMQTPTPEFDQTLLINAAPTRVLAAFVEPEAVATWWRAVRSVTTARVMGVFAIEWAPTPDEDEVLGRLGGIFHGTVMDYVPGRELFIGNAWWIPPEGEPIGPMALSVSCRMDGPACRLRVRQTGFEEGTRWRRYYTVIAGGWRSSLAALKEYLEE
jgi:uncharacterized protein YndB with AHSA1/START domain